MLSGRALGALLVAAAALAVIVQRHRRPIAPPEPETPAVEPGRLAPEPYSALRVEDEGDAKRYVVANRIAGPIEAACAFVDADNVVADPPLPRRVRVPAHAERAVALVRSLDPARNAKSTVSCRAVPGDSSARPAQDATYRLPFYAGTAFTVEQGFDGAFSHRDVESRYAVDFGVPVGTPVIAARAGTVVQVEEGFVAHGLDLEKFGDRANYVRVLHADGTMAVYAHLAPHSAIVTPGARVEAGDLLAKSGDTGYSTGPHLHFAVQANEDMTLTSLPFAMDGVDPLHARR